MGFTNKDKHRHTGDYETDMYTGITTFHGLVRIYNARSCLSRFFWVSVVLIAYTVFVVQAFSLLQAYRLRPTKYESNIRVPANGLEFPAVTFCSFSPVALSYVKQSYEEIHRNESILQYLLLSYMSLENFLSLSQSDEGKGLATGDLLLQRYNDTKNGSFSFTTFFNDTGFKCEDLFKFCSFGGLQFNCCAYAQPVMTDVGKCWKFERFGAESWMQRQFVSGQSYGLEVLIDAKTGEYPKGLLPSSEKGIRYYVHRQDEVPQMSSKSIGVSPGRIAYGPIRMRSWRLLPQSDWGFCQSNWSRTDIPVALRTYTLSNCELNCLAHYFLDHCDCVPIKYHIHERHPVCSPHKILNCFHRMGGMRPDLSRNRAVAELTTGAVAVSPNRTYWYQCSGVECGIECDRRSYASRLSYAELSPELSFQSRFRDKNVSYAKANYVLLKIFYEDISYEEHLQQRALDATTILSNIGGNTGMFLGMSVITLAEIAVFFTKWAWATLDRSRAEAVHEKLSEEKQGEESPA